MKFNFCKLHQCSIQNSFLLRCLNGKLLSSGTLPGSFLLEQSVAEQGITHNEIMGALSSGCKRSKIKLGKTWNITGKHHSGVFRTLSSILDEAFCKNS